MSTLFQARSRIIDCGPFLVVDGRFKRKALPRITRITPIKRIQSEMAIRPIIAKWPRAYIYFALLVFLSSYQCYPCDPW